MKDFIAAGTGNSRYLKTSLPDGTTWQEALAMLRNGTFPIDLNGINAEGVTQIGTPLNKANLLSDESAALFGLDGDAVIDDVWELLSTSNTLSTIMVTTEADSRVTATKGGIVKYGTPINDVYIIRGLTPGSWTVTAEKGTDTASQIVVISAPQQYQVTLTYPRIYGVSWRFGNSSAMTRTDDAAGFADPQPYVLGASTVFSPFDNLMPWAGMERVTDEVCGELVAIPKFWYKLEYIVEEVGGVETNVGINIKISPTEQQGFHVSPAHMPRTSSDTERDIVYVGRYKCDSSTLKSETGKTAKTYFLGDATRIESIESGKSFAFDAATWFTVVLLYLVEYADWDSQKKIGYGSRDGGATSTTTGYTDAMPYHTGTMKQSRSVYGNGTQYRYLEGMWDVNPDVIFDMKARRVSGAVGKVLVAGRYNAENDVSSMLSPELDYSGGYVTAVEIFDNSASIFPIMFPSRFSVDDSVGTCDWFGVQVTDNYQYCFLNNSTGSQKAGIFGVDAYNITSSGSYGVSCRLIKLP